MAMTEADYLEQMRQLLPPGPAWDREFYGAEVDQVLQGMVPEFARIDARGDALLAELFPPTMKELLPDWEAVMGLPDECLPDDPSFGQRKAAVLRRHLAQGAQDLPYFVGLAQGLGYPDATAVEWRAPRFGRSRFGKARFGTWAAQFIWTIKLGQRHAGGRRFGVALWGERFGANPSEAVECVIKRWAPPFTVVFFEYE
ncbi:putative phage tail protein [Herbaspirillum sp. C7C8]|uniref:YmfQ family protein n=1 Tax=Herbaspirillum sp. C7C8 TaxID=2736665 RepID=UPI001F525546|nr:putative phage tail protein [Herbaspirillum sp. C7C8]MCI1005049.1 DUF2313 domain-containing protein [Herbaspirillum sp. C7C8]